MAYDVLLSGAKTSTGVSSTISLPANSNIRADLILTASGSPTTLDVIIEHSYDGGTTWVKLAAFTQLGAVSSGSQSLHIPAPHSGLLRSSYTISGTSYTFSLALNSLPIV